MRHLTRRQLSQVVFLSLQILCRHRYTQRLERHLDCAAWCTCIDTGHEVLIILGNVKIVLLLIESRELVIIALSQQILICKSRHFHLLLQVDVAAVRYWSFLPRQGEVRSWLSCYVLSGSLVDTRCATRRSISRIIGLAEETIRSQIGIHPVRDFGCALQIRFCLA